MKIERAQIETLLSSSAQRLAAKGFLVGPGESISVRIPGAQQLLLIAGLEDWSNPDSARMETASLEVTGGTAGLHAAVYRTRSDVGAIAIVAPKGVRLLARSGVELPPIFDEQVRHIGPAVPALRENDELSEARLRNAFAAGNNAALLGERLLCLGMTSERLLCNVELYEKCAQASVIAWATKDRIRRIPWWVRLIANRRLLNDERRAAKAFGEGRFPEGTQAY